MAKLSHIDDVERRGQDAEAQQMLEAQQALVDARRAQQAAEQPRFERFEQAPAQQAASAQQAVNRTADEEADFHGLDQGSSMELGQKLLIVLALAVVVAAAVYVLNTFFGWF